MYIVELGKVVQLRSYLVTYSISTFVYLFPPLSFSILLRERLIGEGLTVYRMGWSLKRAYQFVQERREGISPSTLSLSRTSNQIFALILVVLMMRVLFASGYRSRIHGRTHDFRRTITTKLFFFFKPSRPFRPFLLFILLFSHTPTLSLCDLTFNYHYFLPRKYTNNKRNDQTWFTSTWISEVGKRSL